MSACSIVIRLRAYRGDQGDTTECFNGLRDEAADEIERLRAARGADLTLLAQMMLRLDFSTGHGDSVADLVAELEPQIERLRTDAARYRWLRQHEVDVLELNPKDGESGYVIAGKSGDELDAAIDTAKESR